MSKLASGQTVEIKGFILVSAYGFVTFAQSGMEDYGYTTVMPHTITATVPDAFNAVAAEIAAIEKKMDTMADEYHGKVAQLKERIASLLCIENAPVAAKDDTRSLIVGQAVAHHDGVWPDPFSSDAIFFNGLRITKDEFTARAALAVDSDWQFL